MKASFTATWFRNYNCSRGFSFWRVVMIGFLVITGMSAGNSYGQSYCIPAQSLIYPSGYYISNVSITGGRTNFTNNTVAETASYGDYSSSQVASQVQGLPVTISATNVSTNNTGMVYNVYVDYNDNGVFTDPGELVIQMKGYTAGTVSGSFTIPVTASPGTHRMRINADAASGNYPSGPCIALGYGETEDYGLTVIAQCIPPTMQSTIQNYTNNTSGNSLTVNWARGNGDNVLIVGRLTSAVVSIPVSGSSYDANTVFGSGTDIGTGNFVVYNGAGTSVNISGLTPGVSYTFTCYEYNSASLCYKTPGSTLAIIPGLYCIPPQSLHATPSFYLSNVTTTGGFSDFTNTTGAETASYGDYSSTKIASQVQGSAITISATNVSQSGNYGMDYNVYVDYNDNGIFTDPGELVLQMGQENAGTNSGSFTIPANAPPGTHKMRIRGEISYDLLGGGYPKDPCSQLQYGETEDYGLTVKLPCIQPTIQATIGSYTNNNSGSNLTVNWTRGNGDKVMVVGCLTGSASGIPLSGTSYDASTIFGSGTQIGNGNFVVYNGTGTSVDVTGLVPGASYTFTCYEYHTGEVCYKTPGSALAVIAGVYCVPPPPSQDYLGTYISNITTTGGITNFTNTTGRETASYGNYSLTKIASQSQGSPINIFATSTPAGMNYNVYVDYNDNGEFTDPGELVLHMGNVYNQTLAFKSFTIPDNAPLGTHRMRVKAEPANSGLSDDPCVQSDYGETQDYALTVTASTGDYCLPGVSNYYNLGDQISNVTTTGGILNFTNTTGIEPSSYGNYSSGSIAWQSPDLPITISATSPTAGMYYNVYVDYNDNKVFTDPGELVLQMSQANAGAVSGNFTIPADAPLGTHRMRVRAENQGYPTAPCGPLQYGETEDYGLKIMAACTPPTTQATLESFTNNSTGDNMTVNWTRGNGTGGILVVGRLTSSVLADPAGSLSYTANSTFGSGSQIANGNFVVYNGTGTSVNVTGLTSGVSYTFTCYEYNNTSTCYKIPGSASEVTSGYCKPAQSQNYNCCGMYMSNVTTTGGITNFTNISGVEPASYGNYSSTKIASQSQNSPLTISATSVTYGLNYNVYVDYNDNGVFTDAGELVLQMRSTAAGIVSGSFTIPADAPVGTHRLRLRAEYNAYPQDPCSPLKYGETEDYALTVIACIPPAITTDVSSPLGVCVGGTAPELSVTATGTGTLHYQWYSNTSNSNSNGSPVGTDASTYTPDVSAAGTYYYYVIVSSDCGTKTSSVSTVVVNPTTVITKDVSSPSPLCADETAPHLTVTASGSGTLHYQWYSNSTNSNSNGSPVGTDASTFTPGVSAAGTYYYYVIVSGDCGTKTSSVATVVVNPTTAITTDVFSPSPINDVGTAPELRVIAIGTGTLHYQWYSNTSNSNSNGSPVGTDASAYTPPVSATGTYYYYVIVSGDCGSRTSSVATVIVNVVPAVAGTINGGATVCSGANSATLTLSGFTGTIQWQSSSDNETFKDISNASSASYMATDLSATTWYRAFVTSGTSSATSSSVAVTVNPNTAISTDVFSLLGVCAGGTAPELTVTASGSGTLHYQWYSNSTNSNSNGSPVGTDASTYTPDVSAAGTYYYYVIVGSDCGTKTSSVATVVVNPTTVITKDVSSPSPVCAGGTAPDLSVTASGSGIMHYQWYSNTTNSNSNGSPVGPDASTFTPDVSVAGTYYFYVTISSDCGNKTSAVATVVVNPNIVITKDVSSPSPVCAGGTAPELTVTASGSGTLHYHWYSNTSNSNIGGSAIGTDASTYTPPVSVAGTYYYYVTITSDCGSKTSIVATVVVNPTTAITTDVSSPSPVDEGATAPKLSVIATGMGALHYQWYSNTTNSNSNGSTVGTSASTYTPPVSAAGTYYYYVIVSGNCGSKTSSVATVIVNAVPMAYTSSNTLQLNNGAVLPPSTTNKILQVQVVTTGSSSPFNMTSMNFSTTGSTDASKDIANAKVYYTGTSPVFATTTQFGSTYNNPNGSFTVDGSQPLSAGVNYFWLSYELQSTPHLGDAIDGCFNQFVLSGAGGTQTPVTSCPAGNATINLDYCIPPQSVNYQSGSFYLTNISTTGGITNFTSYPESYYSNSYANYSASKIASQAQNSPITLNLGYYSVYGIYEFYYYVYIDFNDNGVFSDPGEMYLTQVSEDGSTASITFTIPADAPIGTHRMRVRADILSRVYDECSQLYYGETDDYGLTVIGCSAPAITTDVSSPETVDAGGTAPELSVKASGTGTLHYQWYSNTTNSNIGGSAIGQDAATYTPDVSTAGTYYYYVVVTGDCGTKTSSVATVTVNAADIQAVAGTITGEATVCPGTNSTMLTLSDYTGTIQWQSSTDNQSFNDISSESSANYTATDLSATTWYRAVVSSGNTSATSSSVAVTVNPNTAITTDVSSPAVVCAGGTAPDLTVAASGSGTLHYQWYSNTTNSNIGGSAIGTDASIYTPDVSAAGSYYYYVIVSSDCGIKTSAVAMVVVNTITDITTDVYAPSPYSIDINGTAPQFFVIADGSNLSYQWYSNTSNSTSNGTLITDATKATYTPAVNAAGTTYYYVVVSGDCGSKTSNVATVTVNATPVAGSISGAASVCAPTNRTTLTLNAYTGTIIQWQSSTDNVTFDVIAGANNTSYNAINLSATTWYRAVVISGGTSATTSSVAVTVNPNTAISTDVTTTPYSIDVNSQAPVLNVVAGGNNVHYQWYSNTINSNMGGSAVGQDAANYTPDVSTAGTYYYYVVVSGDCGSKTSSVATVIVNAAEIQAVAGTVSGAGTVCSGTNSTMLTLTGYTGTIQWQSSTDNQTFNDIGSASSSSYRATDLSVTTWYRAVVTSGNTSATTSSVACQVISAIDASASSNPVALGSAATLSATISPAISGVAISFNVDPGTGVTTTYMAVTNNSGVATTTPISGLAVNLYKVIATAACATSDPAYVAVYDPNSSFITGGGWIISPAGALVAQPSLTGKANFGFVAKYKKGKSQVDGDTEFQFQDGNFNFESSALDPGSLVISGSKGTYRGEGTVNGQGDYGFMVSAVDGQITGGGGTDLFRIKIWDISHGNSVVYDNNMGKDENGVPSTILGGGSIVIHYAKGKNSRIMNTGTHVEITNSNSNEVTGSGKLTVTVMPNPTSYYFTLGLKSLSKEKINLTVTDLLGRTIEQRTDIATNSTIQLAHRYHPGVYFATFVQGNDKVTVRLIKEGK